MRFRVRVGARPMRLAAVVVLATVVSGCMLVRLDRDVKKLQALALLRGTVTTTVETDAPIVVVLTTGEPPRVADTSVLVRPGGYYFMVPAGRYDVAAFVDLNRDFTYQPDAEPASRFDPASAVTVSAGDERTSLDIAIEAVRAQPLPVVVRDADRRFGKLEDLPDLQLGTVVKITDDRFSDANGSFGLWQPMEFIGRVGAGVYFLEPYDGAKIPVLFIHGVGGHPGNFRSLVARLDRRRFQPWLVYYPSGFSPPFVARGVKRMLNVLGARYRPEQVAIVAHSMGGLVARSLIDQWYEDEGTRRGRLERLITLSTPWNGHPGARLGLHAPVVMPSWPDIVPGSAFLQKLFDRSLPPTCEYSLFFAYGGGSPLYGEPNDGTVTLASQLLAPAQREARHMYGCNCDHGAILDDETVGEKVAATLASIRTER